MNLQYAFFHLALVAPRPAPAAEPLDDETPKAANDNHRIWPLMPFPEDWCASN